MLRRASDQASLVGWLGSRAAIAVLRRREALQDLGQEAQCRLPREHVTRRLDTRRTTGKNIMSCASDRMAASSVGLPADLGAPEELVTLVYW